MRRFVLEKKLVAVVRYYEHLYVISDRKGERIYTGLDEKVAKTVLTLLNGYYFRKGRKKELKKKRKARRPK